MKTLVEIMARSVGARPQQNKNCDVEYLLSIEALEQLIELVRADERNSWPLEMEAMERQVNILTDALAQEREACAKVCDDLPLPPDVARSDASIWEVATLDCAEAIRARSNT